MANLTRITLQDIARSINVPAAQVTKVILGQPDIPETVRRRVLLALGDAGHFRLSQDVGIGSIGVVLPGLITDDYVGEVMRGITDAAKAHNYSIILNVQNPDRSDDLAGLIGPGGCDGVIPVVPGKYDEILRLCREYGRNCALIDYPGDETSQFPTIEVNNQQAIVQVMNHLFALGHHRIGFITGSLLHASARQRLDGYKAALRQAGLPFEADLVQESNWLHPEAYEATKRLLALTPRPTAIVASNDLSAFGAMQAAHQAGLEIGWELSITGFDDIRMASTVSPGLTTVRQPMYQLGETAVNLLIRRIEGQPIADLHPKLNTELVIRESTGRVRV